MPDALPNDLLAQRLPDWYRGVSVELDGDLIGARRSAIEDMSSALDSASASDAVSYAHGRKHRGEHLINWIRQSARDYDETFASDEADLEPQVMVACAIANRLATAPFDTVSTALSMLVHCAEFRGLRGSAKALDLSGLAARQLQLASARERETPKPGHPTVRAAINKLFRDLAQVPADDNAVTNAAIAPRITAIEGGLGTIARRLDALEKTVSRSARVMDEQLEQTAWLLEDYCELTDQAWTDVGSEAVILYAATELAALTVISGSPTLSVMLSSTLVKAGRDPAANVDPLTAVRRAAKRLDSWPKADSNDDLLPLSAAVAAWREMNGKSGWTELAKRKRGGGTLPTVTEHQLANQAHRELVLGALLTND